MHESVAKARPRNHEQARVNELIPQYIIPPELREQTTGLIKFLQEYFKYLNQEGMPTYELNHIVDENDIDKTSENFLDAIQAEIASIVPESLNPNVDRVTLYKRIVHFYRAKGTPDSIKTFFRIFFENQEYSLIYGEEPYTYQVTTDVPISNWYYKFKNLVHPVGLKFIAVYALLAEASFVPAISDSALIRDAFVEAIRPFLSTAYVTEDGVGYRSHRGQGLSDHLLVHFPLTREYYDDYTWYWTGNGPLQINYSTGSYVPQDLPKHRNIAATKDQGGQEMYLIGDRYGNYGGPYPGEFLPDGSLYFFGERSYPQTGELVGSFLENSAYLWYDSGDVNSANYKCSNMHSNATWTVAFWYRGDQGATEEDAELNGVIMGRGVDPNYGDQRTTICIVDGRLTLNSTNPTTQAADGLLTTGPTLQLQSTTAINDNVWHHCVVTCHGDHTASLYVDGKLEIDAVDFRYPGQSSTTLYFAYLMVGDQAYDSDPPYGDSSDDPYSKDANCRGSLKDLRIYSVALTQDDVETISGNKHYQEAASILKLLSNSVITNVRNKNHLEDYQTWLKFYDSTEIGNYSSITIGEASAPIAIGHPFRMHNAGAYVVLRNLDSDSNSESFNSDDFTFTWLDEASDSESEGWFGAAPGY